ncbi:MAG TPA: DUF2071 domain-containing protein [Bryobacteraceae bacterium]|nr:DUF2071 domain-containing protein [Bryobacteraceae bacterium]
MPAAEATALERPVMRQIWRALTFLHWRYDPRVIRPLLPGGLKLDIFDGSAWVGLVPFELADVAPPKLPAVPWLSQFPETNVRTYVRGPDGEPGVWFFTLEADRLIAVMAARAWYHLPYRWAKMNVQVQGNRVEYRSERSRLFGKGHTDIAIEAGDAMQPGELDHFLTARFRLYAASRTRLAYAPVEHAPWPLQQARVLRLDENLVENSGVPDPQGEPLVHFSRELKVRAGAPQWM